MNKFAIAALLGSASACHWREWAKHQKIICHDQTEEDFPHNRGRSAVKELYAGWVKGIYQENHDIVDEQCFGDWLDPTLHNVWGLKKKMHEDFWSVSMTEVKSVGNEAINAIAKNLDACHVERVQDDFKGWCLENTAQCIFMEGLEDRLFDNLLEIAGEVMDLYKLFNHDDTCYTWKEMMGEIYRFADDMGQMASSVSGFDYKWDQSIERKHIKKAAFHKQIHEAMKEFKGQDHLAMMFPDLAEFIKGLFPKRIHKTPAHKQAWNPFMDYQHKTEAKAEAVEQHKPQHHKRFDPLGDLFKAMIPHPHHQQQHHQQQQQIPQWGQFKQPMFQQPVFEMPQFQQPQFDFQNFKLF